MCYTGTILTYDLPKLTVDVSTSGGGRDGEADKLDSDLIAPDAPGDAIRLSLTVNYKIKITSTVV